MNMIPSLCHECCVASRECHPATSCIGRLNRHLPPGLHMTSSLQGLARAQDVQQLLHVGGQRRLEQQVFARHRMLKAQ